MKTTNKSLNHLVTLFAAVLPAIFLAAGSAQAATTIYNDDFNRPSTVALNGQAWDDALGTAWTANAWLGDGSVASGNNNADNHAFLPFTPTAGNIYKLSATLTAPTLGTGWVGIGFAASGNPTSGNFWANGTAPWFLYRPGGGNVDSFAESLGSATNFDLGVATNSVDHGDYATSATFDIVLDTTAATWTAEWFINGSSVRPAVTYGTNPTINHVGFGRENGTTTDFSSFSLTVVPEPSAALLGGLGCLFFLRRRR